LVERQLKSFFQREFFEPFDIFFNLFVGFGFLHNFNYSKLFEGFKEDQSSISGEIYRI